MSLHSPVSSHPTQQAGGDILKFAGDATIVVWPQKAAVSYTRLVLCIVCLLAYTVEYLYLPSPPTTPHPCLMLDPCTFSMFSPFIVADRHCSLAPNSGLALRLTSASLCSVP